MPHIFTHFDRIRSFYTLFLLTESIAAFGIPIVPSGCLTGVTSTDSQSTGASAAANILFKRYMWSIYFQIISILTFYARPNSRYLWQSSCHCTYRCTEAAISGPIPSPGINVTVFLVAKLIVLLSTSDSEIGSALLASFEILLIIVKDN